jgi:type VI secretion system secreted protein VgrG
LASARVCVPHVADGWDDMDRLARAQHDHQRHGAHTLLGRSGVRTLAPGAWQDIDDFAPFQGLDQHHRSLATVRVEHFALNNLPAELHAPAQALLGEPRWPAWTDGDPTAAPGRGADAKPPHRYVNRFEAVPRSAPIAPPPLLEHESPRLRPLTGLVLAPQGMHVHTDELGRSRVRLLGGEPGADTTAWVRHRTPWAGEGVGFSSVLRPGTEVDVEWLGFDRPVIAGCHFNAGTAPPRVAQRPGLPHNQGQTTLVSRELGGTRQQHLLLDDHPRQPMAQLASDAGHSALSLGELATPRRQGEADPRGNGFELRSDDSGAIRTAKALLLSAWARLEAADGQLSAEEHVALMQDCLALFKSLGRYAAEHQGLPVDDAAQERLLSDVKGAAGGSNVAPRSEGGAPTLSLTAPAGIAASTPRTILHCAGVNIDSVATQHVQWTAGQRLNANAGQGISLFAHQGGIKAIAHQGKWLMQSQHGDIEANAAENIKWTATNGQLVGMARKIVLVAEDGSFVQIGEGGITLGTQGAVTHKAASFAHTAPATLGAQLPAFGQGGADQHFVLRYGSQGGVPALQRRFEIEMSAGSTVSGTSDEQGRTELLQRDAMHIARIRILND